MRSIGRRRSEDRRAEDRQSRRLECEKDKEQKAQIPGDDWMNRMIPAGLDDSLCEGWVPSESGMNRMGSLAGTDGKGKAGMTGWLDEMERDRSHK